MGQILSDLLINDANPNLDQKRKSAGHGDITVLSADTWAQSMSEERSRTAVPASTTTWRVVPVQPSPLAGAAPPRWMKHYNNSHKILLVGEGDFSFSACLAKSFGSAYNMYATSLDEFGFLIKNYKRFTENVYELKKRGCTVMHGVDATEMADNYLLGNLKFDRIVFNFPHAGFFKGESRQSQISRNQKLVLGFLKNAKKMINKDGEIHISHKSMGFFLEWNLEVLASCCGLRLKEEVPFYLNDYPGYQNKYGFGGDKNFDCNPSKTYKFGLPSLYMY